MMTLARGASWGRALGGGALLVLGGLRLAAAQDVAAGKQVYVKWCAGCHGETGDGKGDAAQMMLPRPRDFTGAVYKIRSTASGALPTDADLERSVDDGLFGTAMPAWKTRLSDSDRHNVIAYIKTFSAFFTDTTQRPVPLQFSSEPSGGTSPEALKIGRQFYDSIQCWKCHGHDGRGDGPSAPTLHDDPGQPIFAADLHQNWRFRGGPTTEDIYHRLRTGVDGTPMPSFSDLVDKKFLTDEQLWRVAEYVRSLSPAKAPEVRDVIHAPEVHGALPVSPDDSVWNRIDSFYFPLVGQVIHKARWFNPAVTAIWVQAVHNAEGIAMRFTWDDRSQSPDTTWFKKFAPRVLATMASDDSTADSAQNWPDQLAVQFPMTIPEGMARPYFLMGSSSGPVYQWRWTSAPRRVVAGRATGIDSFDSLPASGGLAAQAVYDQGQWRVVIARALATPDSSSQLQFAFGRAIPIALFAWDGSNGEHGSRMAVSTWYFLALDRPTPPGTYISPVIAMAITVGLGMLVIARAQRRGGTGRV